MADGIHGGEEGSEVPLASIVGHDHAVADLFEQTVLVGDGSPEEGGLGAQDDRFLVKLVGVGGEAVGVQDEGHRGQRALGGEEVLDEGLDWNRVGDGMVIVIVLAMVIEAVALVAMA